MKDLIRKILKEAMGVPENITKVATEIYNEVMNSIDVDDTVEILDGRESWFKRKYVIGDMKIKKVDWKFDIRRYDEEGIQIAGMSTGGYSKVTKKFKIKTVLEDGVFNITFLFVAPETATGPDFIEYMKKEKVEFVSSISHELKHRYDSFKRPKTQLTQRASYMAYTQNGFGNIKPINRFINNLYFTHSIENLVRPSEIAGAIDAGEITKKGFYEFLLNNRVYNHLKEIQGFTYEGFRKDLFNYLDEIKELFDMNDINYDNMTDDEIVDKTLDLLLLNIQQWKAQTVHRFLADNALEALLGFRGEKGAFFDEYLKKLGKFDGNAKKYFEYEEKMFKFVSTKMIKKIVKLYDMAKDVKTESIINWVLWKKLNPSESKIVTEYKYKPKN